MMLIKRAPPSTRSLIYWAPTRVLPKPRPANRSQVDQLPSGAIWFFRAQKTRQSLCSANICSGGSWLRIASRSSFDKAASCSAREAFVDKVQFMIKSVARYVQIGIDQNVSLDIQQRPALQLAGQPAAISKIFMQPRRQQPQRVVVADLGRCAQPLVKRTPNDAVMIDQGKRFIGDYFFKLILDDAGTRDVCRPSLCRNVVVPVPAQCVIWEIKFSRCSLDRCAGCQEPLNPHTLQMVATLAAPGS